MNVNLDVILRSSIPADMQGRVYSCRNTLQFFTIPLGFFLGGALVDEVFSPLMAVVPPGGMLDRLFGRPRRGRGGDIFACWPCWAWRFARRSCSFCAGNPGAMEIPPGKGQEVVLS